MKRLLIASILLLGPRFAFADAVWRSSHTTTADTTKSLCGQNVQRRCRFHGIRVGHATTGTVTLYDAQGSANSSFAVIYNTAAVVNGGADYDVLLTSGCTYTTSAANQSTTLLYDCQ